MVAPLLAMAITSIAFTASVKTSKKETRYVAPSVLGVFTALIAGYILSIPMNTDDSIANDTMRPTDDGLFEYRIELVNPFQRNARIRLFVKEVATEDEIHIYLDIPWQDVRGSSYVVLENFIWAYLERCDEFELYILHFPARQSNNRINIGRVTYRVMKIHTIGYASFLIDIPNRTATRID